MSDHSKSNRDEEKWPLKEEKEDRYTRLLTEAVTYAGEYRLAQLFVLENTAEQTAAYNEMHTAF